MLATLILGSVAICWIGCKAIDRITKCQWRNPDLDEKIQKYFDENQRIKQAGNNE